MPVSYTHLQEFQKTQKARDDKRQKAAEDTKKKLGGKLVSVKVSAGEGGKLFGSVTSAQVAEALSAQFMVNIDKKDIKLDESIKQAGSYTFRIKPVSYTHLSRQACLLPSTAFLRRSPARRYTA